ncbi:Putative suppressor of disruption of TFIIS [Yamadazyma tenuis]|uniref:Pyrimidine 5-nucleotidase n=1 Tax=Candida tenuis (strain ATCC 10573 / BCRC 21748 / CBS 615 / JCM 9827 / NBRC 10315 / NRRL Y-1498 / VKM Y-70) TaxID=590646 RepID=G3BD54_CANTC|nr:uncharacterized protein CANTEDRAFT_116969 [Yamadazyma tenuis ATCC 10573]EGV60920.1 hypothetical protein CANTEDRAFT_116969 [Yamadazyma tenuis ATCC 10573]WEJ93809.1 Putative suppressor of disruption of TFIIS [Yamadazyma tenuis]
MTSPVTYTNPELVQDTRLGCTVQLPLGFGPVPPSRKKIFYFDIDNCLYQRSTKIHDLMQLKIHDYFKTHLELDDKDAHALHMNYYQTYGLALEGLVRNHKVDALKYNEQVDDSLDLKSVLSYNQELRNMLIRIKKTHQFDCFWLLTNAYKNHALRVVSFLGIGDLFDGLTYCDYSESPIVCKPMKLYFDKCLSITGVDNNDLDLVYFVDDSEINVKAALKLGWGRVFHFIEIDADYERILQSDDFGEYYSQDNSDGRKITILRNILELESAL